MYNVAHDYYLIYTYKLHINVEIPEEHQVIIDQLIVCNVCMSVVTLGDGLVILGVLGDHCVQHVQHVP